MVSWVGVQCKVRGPDAYQKILPTFINSSPKKATQVTDHSSVISSVLLSINFTVAAVAYKAKRRNIQHRVQRSQERQGLLKKNTVHNQSRPGPKRR